MAQPPTAAEIDFDTPGFRTGYVRLSHSDDRHAFSVIPVPVAVLVGGQPGPTMFLSGGTHGDEYEGQALLHRLLRATDPAGLTGRLIVMPALNLPAVRAGDSALYKVEFQGERCTLELAGGRLGWTLGQLRGRANARVTPETRTEVERWFATARNASARPTSWMPQLAHEDESEAYPPDELQGIFPL